MTLHVVIPGQQWAIENGVETKTKPVIGYPNKKACQYAKAEISDILLKKHATDAHFTSYAVLDGIGAYRYNYPIFSDQKFQLIREAGGGIEMALVVFESDSPAKNSIEPGALDEWWELEKTKVDAVLSNHPGGLAWRTKGGYRIAWRCPPGRLLQSVDDAVLWRKNYLSAVCHFQRVYDIHFDPACGEWNRLQRVPMGTRLGEEGPVIREVLGGSLVGVFDTRSVPSADDVKQSRLAHAAAWKEPRIKGHGQPVSPCDEYNAPTIGVPSVWERILSKRSMLGRSLGPTKHVARCPNASKHTTAGETSTVLYAAEPGSIYGRPYCSHSHCVGLDWRVELGVGDDEWHTYVQDIKAEAPLAIVIPLVEVEAVPSGVEWQSSDTDEFVVSKLVPRDNNPTQPAGISHNVSILLTGMRHWKGRLTYDAFKATFAWSSVPKELAMYHVYDNRVCDADVSYIQAWLLKGAPGRPVMSCAVEAVRAGIQEACRALTVDSLKDHVRSVGVWDGVKRLDTWLIDYFHAADTKLNRAIGAKWLMAAAARAISPGCVADMMPILEGDQEMGKGYCLSIMFGDDWVVIPHGVKMGSRDFEQKVTDAWCVHDDELVSLKKTGIDHTKSFLTQRHMKYRKAYDRDDGRYPVRFLVIGSTNGRKYLDDEENRRFWPIRVGWLKPEELKAVRNQLWAEALDRLAANESYFIRKRDLIWGELAEQHEQKKTEHPFDQLLQSALTASEGRLVTPFRLVDAMRACGLDGERLEDPKMIHTVSSSLSRLGLQHERRMIKGVRSHYWAWKNDVMTPPESPKP